MNPVSKNNAFKEALANLERFCAYQERCLLEVRQKLKDIALSEEEKLTLIDQLIQSDLLNENRFAEHYTRGKFRIKEWGKMRIRGQLRSKNIDDAAIRNALDQLDPVEYQAVFEALAKRKLDGIKTKNVQQRRKKLADMLLYRGWEFELVYDKVRELIP